MMTIKPPREIETMAAAGRIVAETLALVARHVRPGVSTEQLDRVAEDFIRSHPGARPSFKGLYDFPATLCTSINQEVVHGIPSPRRVLKEGDLLSVDVGVWLDGLHADSAATFPVGKVSPEAERLLAVTQQALTAGGAQARAGNHVGDIGHAVQQVAEGAGYSVGRELVGHGIGPPRRAAPRAPAATAAPRSPCRAPRRPKARRGPALRRPWHRSARSGCRSSRFPARARAAERHRGPSRAASGPRRRAPRPRPAPGG